jgi:hypothetical protein
VFMVVFRGSPRVGSYNQKFMILAVEVFFLEKFHSHDSKTYTEDEGDEVRVMIRKSLCSCIS